MGSQHSYRITLKNNRTDKRALEFVRQKDATFLLPDSKDRKAIAEIVGLKPGLSRAFDLVVIDGHRAGESLITDAPPESITLIEVKSTKKKLEKLPYGFFFGATENEFQVARQLGDRYKFCFVSLHPQSRGFALLTLSQLEPLIKTKRTQFQINLKPH